MNRIYRLIWSRVSNTWVAVSEHAKGRGKSGRSAVLVGGGDAGTASFAIDAVRQLTTSYLMKPLAAALALAFAPLAFANPVGGQVVSGTGSIAQAGSVTTISQASQNLSLNWQGFNVAPAETVNFVQPSASAIAVNRIFDTNGSQILGHLNANGQVWLINPNGVLFGQGAQVNVGGLVASALDFNDTTLNSNARTFSGNGVFGTPPPQAGEGQGSGSVINLGTINAASGGYVALLGNHVSNQGIITAQLGTVALGAGSAATLTFSGNNLVKMQIDQSTLNNLAENGGLIQADGGMVIMNAGAKNALLASVVNNTGVIEARTVDNHEGTITLLGGMTAGTVNVGGTLDASAPSPSASLHPLPLAGEGNTALSSNVGGTTLPLPLAGEGQGRGGFIETSAAHVHIADTAKITTAALNGLSGTWLIDPADFTIAATGGDMTGATLTTNLGSGNVTILSSQGTVVTSGSGNINVNDVVSWSANTLTLNAQNNININAAMNGSGTASLALLYGQSSANGGTSTYNVNAAVNLPAGNNFSTQLGSSGAVVTYTVITALGAAGDATAAPATMTLQGINTGLAGNYALGSNIDATATSTWNANAGFTPVGGSYSTPFTGIFDGLGHTISNLTINTPSASNVGLFGYTFSTSAIRNVGLVNGSVTGGYYVGGLVGTNYGTISNSYATGSVSGSRGIGGLVGNNSGTISNSYATGSVSGPSYVGGLVGDNAFGTISNSYATGSVSGTQYVGELVGYNFGAIGNSYATGSVSGSSYVGGLAGGNEGTISTSYATGSVSGSSYVGGLVGYNHHGTVSNSYYNTTANPGLTGIGVYTGGTPIADVAGTVLGLTTTQMQTAANFAGFTFTTTPDATGTANAWVMVDGDGSLNNAGSVLGAAFPMLASEYSTTINNAHQLQLMVLNLAGNYTLGSNINAAATGSGGDMWGSSGFVPVGHSYATVFTGTFDGLGHTISNLTINTPSAAYVGLFGYVSSTSVISNVGMLGGSVSGYNYVGELAGKGGTISNSYATGSVSGTGNGVGGLAGEGGTISNSYATGSVSGNNFGVGGLVGAIFSGTISNSYATGSVTGTGTKGGLVGSPLGGTISNSYYNTTVNPTLTGIGGKADVAGTVWGLTTTQMLTAANFAGFNFTTTPDASGNNWVMVDVDGSLNNAGGATGAVFPMLASEYSTTINNAHQLQLMAMALGGNYTLGANINAAATGNGGDVWQSTGFIPVGNSSAQFTGTFDGLGHTIGGLTINLPSNANVGLFGYGSASSVIRNVGLVGGSVSGSSYVGGLVGMNYGATSNSYVTGSVSGANNIGGLAGGNQGTISASYATGSVSGTGNNVGGLVGNSSGGTISNSYATGNVSDTGGNVGGLVGNSGGTISNSYATGNVSDTGGNVGGLVGYSTGAIGNSYATGSVVGSSDVGGLVGANFGTISASYATGSVSGGSSGSDVGGLVGGNYGMISASYATGSVSGSSYVGGLVGVNGSGGTISDSYATGSVSGTGNYIGGLVGGNTSGTISNSFYNSDSNTGLTGIGSSTGAVTDVAGSVWGMSTSAMQNQANFTGATGTGATTDHSGNGNVNPGWDFTTPVWRINPAVNHGYACLAWTAACVAPPPATQVYLDLVPTSGSSYTSVYGTAPVLTYAYDTSATYIAADVVSSTLVVPVGTPGSTGAPTATSNVNNYTVTPSIGGITGVSSAFRLAAGNAVTWSVTPATLTVTGTTVANKTYDGTTTASLSGGTLSGAVNGDSLTLTQAGTFASKNVGTGVAVTAADTLGGTAAGNYMLTQPSGLSANITPLAVTLTAQSVSKTYDGGLSYTTTAGDLTALDGSLVGGDTVTAATIAYADKNAGAGNKTVSLNAVTINDGNGGNNYSVTLLGNSTSTITPLAVTLTAPAVSKTYDGGLSYTATAGDLTALAGSLVGGDTVTATTIAYTDKNVGAGTKTVSLNAVTINDGNGGNNYSVTLAGNTTSTITPLAITVVATGTDKVYNGTRIDTVMLSSSGVISGDAVNFTTGDAPATFADKNVGAGKTVSVPVIQEFGADAGNYTLSNTSATTTANITPAPLTISGITASNKVYDATTAATVSTSSAVYTGLVAGDSVTVAATGAFGDKNVGTAKTVTLTSTDSGADVGNYSITNQPSTTASITQAPLTISGITASSKVYDATTAAAANTSGAVYTGLIAGDSVTVAATGAFGDKNVGTAKTVTLTSTDSGADAGNYSITNQTTTAANITPAALTISGITASNKVYDATTAATVNTSGAVYTGLIAGDSVTVAATGVFSDKNVGTGKTVTLTSTDSGADVGNYSITNQTTASANITQAPLTISGITANSKVYDATTAATVNTSGAVYTGLFAGDSVTVSATGAFGDKNVGTGKTVTLTSTDSGADAGNYRIINQTGITADITPKLIGVAATGANKVYDGSVNDAPTLSSEGVIAGDTVNFTDTSATFANKNVGNAKTVTVAGIAASGADAGNYTLNNATATTTANITPLAITVVATGTDKVYDGTRNDTVTLSSSGVISGDAVTFSTSDTPATFADKNVGSGKTVSVPLIQAFGADAGNYTLNNTSATTTANITQAPLTISGITASNKVYDATTAATVSTSSAVYTGLVAGDSVTVSATGAFGDKNVGTGKTVTLTSTDSGADVGNYSITNQPGTTANITQAPLTISGITAANKVYDTTTAATVSTSSAVYTGLLGSDAVTVSATGTFNDKNVGNGKIVNLVSNYTGADVGNYSITDQATTMANITPVTLTYVAAPASFLNGQTPSNLGGAVNGFVGGDTLAGSTTGTTVWTTPATPSSQPGQYAITGGGLVAANYVFVQDAGNATALTLKPGTPPAPVVDVTSQMQSNPLTPQVGAAPQALNLSPTITVTQSSVPVASSGSSSEPAPASSSGAPSVSSSGSASGGASSSSGNSNGNGNGNAVVVNTTLTIGANGTLQIVNGGVRLPDSQSSISE